MDQIIAVLRVGAAAENDGPDADELTDVLKVAFSQRNRFDAALTGAVGALDRVAEPAPDGELTWGLSSVKNGYHALRSLRPGAQVARPVAAGLSNTAGRDRACRLGGTNAVPAASPGCSRACSATEV
jgi:hypothetical protein